MRDHLLPLHPPPPPALLPLQPLLTLQLLLPNQPLPDHPLPKGGGDEGVLEDGQPREVLQAVGGGDREEVGMGVSWVGVTLVSDLWSDLWSDF